MFSKIYLLDEAMQHDKFNSDFLVWTDAGINHVFPVNVLSPDNHLLKWY